MWVVVVGRRVFVRSWSDNPTGWYRAFRAEPRGTVHLAEREVAVRAGTREASDCGKPSAEPMPRSNNTKASQEWVRGFTEARRMITTLELLLG